jgi:hypothetical protein
LLLQSIYHTHIKIVKITKIREELLNARNTINQIEKIANCHTHLANGDVSDFALISFVSITFSFLSVSSSKNSQQ